MRCSIRDILKNAGEIAEISGILEYDSLENNGDDIKFTSPISFSGEVHNEDGKVVISGELEFEFKANCHSCGSEFEDSFHCNVLETFSTEPSENEYLLKGETLDLEDMLIDNIRLALPIRLLCNTDCKGICTTCGINLNESDCECSEKNIDSRLTAFSDLLK